MTLTQTTPAFDVEGNGYRSLAEIIKEYECEEGTQVYFVMKDRSGLWSVVPKSVVRRGETLTIKVPPNPAWCYERVTGDEKPVNVYLGA